MKTLYNSNTGNNLIEAFRSKTNEQQQYSNYERIAVEQGYMEIARFFNGLARAVNQHARIIANYLMCSGYSSEEICMEKILPIFTGDTVRNLQLTSEVQGENVDSIYPNYIKIAYDEKYLEAGIILGKIMRADSYFETESRNIYNMLIDGTYFTKNEMVKWVCNRCGYTYIGNIAPNYCPLCGANQEYFNVI